MGELGRRRGEGEGGRRIGGREGIQRVLSIWPNHNSPPEALLGSLLSQKVNNYLKRLIYM